MRNCPALSIQALKTGVLLIVCTLFSAACHHDEENFVYPSLLTEFADFYTDAGGNCAWMTTDDGSVYALYSPLSGLQPESVYRTVCGYELTDDRRDGCLVARIYTTEQVTMLEKQEGSPEDDAPTGVAAVWRGGGYLNFHLRPKTQDGFQEWGFRVDDVHPSSTGNTYHLSLYHRQPGDPYSYTTDIYASLPLGSIEELQTGDSIVFTILTFDGRKTWRFAY